MKRETHKRARLGDRRVNELTYVTLARFALFSPRVSRPPEKNQIKHLRF